ncbi:ankyrin repeat domain-containing protein [Peterkaempfera sp. SMS 1(5)a]|uniref:ankyrin repeat domain-containing protein n=1 Tax=Peterkaempfera podocarpi TaxID=3232308 RepID=UPI003672E5CB
MLVDGPQRLVLAFGKRAAIGKDTIGYEPDAEHNWRTARYLWDGREAAELRHRIGGGSRAPFFHPDGTALTGQELPTSHPGHQDPAALTEWVTLLQLGGNLEAAFAAAGVELDTTVVQARYNTVDPLQVLGSMPLVASRLIPEVQRLTGTDTEARLQIPRSWRASILVERTGSEGGLRVRCAERARPADIPSLPEACWRRLPDLDLLRAGRITPEQLHPLVRASLFPDLPSTERLSRSSQAGPPASDPVRVRCRGEWHEVVCQDGTLQLPHTTEEQRREQAMRAFGGAVAGCFAVQQAWTSGTGRLPRALREQRQELFLRVQHGDTPGVLRLLDAGADPRVRDGRQHTLLHLLHLLDHEQLLPRLLKAGLDLEAKDHHGRTPLHVAVGDRGSPALVQALLDLGARIDVVDSEGWSLRSLIRRRRRRELRFLADRVEREFPGIGVDWWFGDEEDDDKDGDE